jgi:hypothetical protein
MFEQTNHSYQNSVVESAEVIAELIKLNNDMQKHQRHMHKEKLSSMKINSPFIMQLTSPIESFGVGDNIFKIITCK